ncbi:MAG: HRDC domain-containing protein [Phycisphaerae bacterium]|jgi:ribonuclease D|nr:HRDC domain-containing protein [Phycisphaerae bacterium]
MTFRRRQRSKQHHAAHEGEQPHPEPLVLPGVPTGAAELITNAASLQAFLDHARELGCVAFDTEFIGEVAYFPRTCLIQLATRERVALVDPFAVEELDGLWHLVADERVRTIVHAGASDLSPVRRATRRDPTNIIDIQVGAGFIGVPYPTSLGKLIERFLQFQLPKGHTFTDWDARPLSMSQLRYAADDVRYLPLVWEILQGELEAKSRLAWAEQETLVRLADPHEFDARAHMRRASRGYDLTDAQEKLLMALCTARDTIAQAENMPHRSTIPDGALLEMVRSRPTTRPDVAALRGMPRPIVARHGDLLISAVEENPSEPVEWFAVRRRREDDPLLRTAIDRMLAEAQRLANVTGIAAPLAATRADIERFVRRTCGARSRGEPLPPLFEPNDWRVEAFGSAIEAAAGGEWLGIADEGPPSEPDA